jgi:hypothetical protein
MIVEHIEVLAEELSMEAFLRAMLPRILRNVTFEVYPHQGKHDLLKHLPARLQGYSRWLPTSWRIVVVMDRDNDDCKELKARMEKVASDAGLATRSTGLGGGYRVINRLAIEELEAWYFGDWHAVRTAYPRVAEGVPNKPKYRNPDGIAGGTWEAFERILQRAGYFKGGLGKIEAARTIGRYIDPQVNTSSSFQAFRDAVQDLLHASL